MTAAGIPILPSPRFNVHACRYNPWTAVKTALAQAVAARGSMREGWVQARRAPAVRAVLLYGAPQTGKTALVHAVAAQAGAALFDLSPRATDGKYPGKAALMVHMARDPCSSAPAMEQPLL